MARIKGPKKTNRYPDEFKVKAVLLANQPDILAKDVAENLGAVYESLANSNRRNWERLPRVVPRTWHNDSRTQ